MLAENELKKLKAFDSSLFIGQSYFDNDRAQLFSIFQLILKTITAFSGLPEIISQWESKEFSNGKIKPPYTANKIFSPKLVWYGSKIKLKFNGSCLKQDKATFNPKIVVNLFIV